MSMLSVFGIAFETDAKEAKNEVEGLSGALDDAKGSSEGAAGGLDLASDAADSGAMAMGSVTKAIGGMILAYVTLDAVASGVLDNALNIDALGKFTQRLGENIVEMDAWGAAVERNGGSAEAFQGTVDNLSTSLAEMKITGGGEIVNTLAMMGVSATKAGGEVKSAFDVLPEIATAFESMSAGESNAFGKKLGLDQGTILLLQQGGAAVDALVEKQKLLGGVTEQGAKDAAVFNDAWDDTKRAFNGLWMSANSSILPALTSVLELLQSGVAWVKENKTLVEGFFIGVAGVITAMYLPAMVQVAAATLVAIAPFLAIGAAIAAVGVAVALVYEDFQKWASGGESVMGKILGPFEDFKKSMLDIFDAIGDKWDSFVKGFEDSIKYIQGLYNDFFGDDDEDTPKAANGRQQSRNSYLQTDEATDRAQKMVYSYNSSPMNDTGSGYYSNKTSTTNNNISVGGASIDARGMSEQQASSAFSGMQTGQIERAIGQLNNGVDR